MVYDGEEHKTSQSFNFLTDHFIYVLESFSKLEPEQHQRICPDRAKNLRDAHSGYYDL